MRCGNWDSELGLPKEIVFRQTLPRPAWRCAVLGEGRGGVARFCAPPTASSVEEMKKQRLVLKICRGFAVLLPVRSVGDGETSGFTISPSCSGGGIAGRHDGRTGPSLPNELLEKISSRITNEVKGVNGCAGHLEQTTGDD